MEKRKVVLLVVNAVLAVSAVAGMTGEVFAVQAANTYGETCLVCHGDNVGVANGHHLMVYSENLECLACHALVKNSTTQSYSLSFRDEFCFLRCHAPTLAKLDGPFIRIIPSDPADNVDYFPSLQVNVKRKMAEAHHNNYGAPTANSQCGRCHAMVWDPAISAIVTVPVADSAGTAGDVDNLEVVLEPDQLVYDAFPGETIFLSAGQSRGTGLTCTWLLHVGSTSAAALYLGKGPDLNYTISTWTDPNTTNFIELQLKDSTGRFMKKYIAVNIVE